MGFSAVQLGDPSQLWLWEQSPADGSVPSESNFKQLLSLLRGWKSEGEVFLPGNPFLRGQRSHPQKGFPLSGTCCLQGQDLSPEMRSKRLSLSPLLVFELPQLLWAGLTLTGRNFTQIPPNLLSATLKPFPSSWTVKIPSPCSGTTRCCYFPHPFILCPSSEAFKCSGAQ